MAGPGPDSQCPPPGAGRRPRLPPELLARRDRIMFDLVEREGFTLRQTGDVFGVSHTAVRKALVRERVRRATAGR